jgi:hypothetical protein
MAQVSGTKIQYNSLPSFQKDFKALLKKFRTLENDLETAKRNAIELYQLKGIDNQSIFPIESLCADEIRIIKVKKFAYKALKGRGSISGIIIIYAFHCQSVKVDFIEIYFKEDKTNEDRNRIKAYLKTYS